MATPAGLSPSALPGPILKQELDDLATFWLAERALATSGVDYRQLGAEWPRSCTISSTR